MSGDSLVLPYAQKIEGGRYVYHGPLHVRGLGHIACEWTLTEIEEHERVERFVLGSLERLTELLATAHPGGKNKFVLCEGGTYQIISAFPIAPELAC